MGRKKENDVLDATYFWESKATMKSKISTLFVAAWSMIYAST